MRLRTGPKNAPRTTIAAFLSIDDASNRIIGAKSHSETAEEKQ